MALFERILGLLGGDDEDDEYRCIQCGEGYQRSRRECEVCGSWFVAAAENEEGAPKETLDDFR